MLKIEKELQKKKIPYQIRTYDPNIDSAEEAARQMKIDKTQITKSLLLKTTDGESFIMVLIPLPTIISLNKLEKILGERALLASPEEVKEITGYSVGLVSPLVTKRALPVYMDKSVLNSHKIGVGTGIKGRELVIDPKDLKEHLNAEISDIT